MEVSEIESYKLTSTYTAIGSNSSLYNLHAVVIRAGVHIIEITPNLTTAEKDVTVHRSMIKTPKDFPILDVDIDLRKLNREEFCLLHLDYKLFPHLDKMIASEVYTKQVKWIKVEDTGNSIYVLGILSNRGALQLFVRPSFSWKKAADISTLWKDFCFKKWFPNPAKDDFANIERKFKYMHITAFTWCEEFSYRDSGLSLIATVSESGIIALWCIPPKLSEKSPHIVTTTETHLSIQHLYWHKITNKKGWLIIACHDGLLKLYSCESTSKETVSLKFEYEVWKYADLMAITNLKVKQQDNKSIMVFSKENSVLVFSLGSDKILGENFYEFEKKVSAVEILDNTRIFVTLINSQNYEVHIEKPESATRECVPVNFDTTTSLSNYNCYGVSFSKNKLWCLFYLKLNVHYDHLLIKEPNCLLLCVLNQKQKVTPSAVEALIKQNLSIYDVHDYIEYFRIRSFKDTEIVPSNEIKITWDYLNGDIEICRKFFQLAYILMKCYSLSNPKYYTQNKDEITSVEIIFMVCNFLFYQEKITAIRKQYFFYKWLAANVSKLPSFVLEYQRFKKVSDMMNNFTDVCFEEKCDLCTSNVSNYGNLKYVICEKGHKLLRCSFSFLPISSQPTKECTLCHSIVHQSEDTNRCIICDNIF